MRRQGTMARQIMSYPPPPIEAADIAEEAEVPLLVLTHLRAAAPQRADAAHVPRKGRKRRAGRAATSCWRRTGS